MADKFDEEFKFNEEAFKKSNAKVEAALKEVADGITKKGQSPQEAMGIDPAFLESLYEQAYRLYQTGKYVDAAHQFRTLILIDSLEPKHVLGLAACFHMLKEYKNAIESYTFCSVLDPTNPLPYYYSSDCYLKMKEKVSALVSLELAINIAGEQPEYKKIKERALLSTESIKNELQDNDFDEPVTL